MRADFLRLYGLDLEEVPIADVIDMVSAMPRGSRSLAIIAPQTEWTDGEYLLAEAVDALHIIAYGLTGGKGGAKKPKPVPRPGDETKGKRPHAAMPANEILDYLNRTGGDGDGS